LKYDLPAGLVVFLVALPLCLGIAHASKAPLLAGLVAGVIAGLVVGPLSGSKLSVSGPAAGLTVLIAGAVTTLGGFEHILLATMLAGLFQLIAGVLRMGVLASFFPASVVKGMLAAIGVILILKQIPHALGRDVEFEGSESFWMFGHQAHTFSEIDAAVRTASPGIVILTALCLGVLILWDLPLIARQAWSRLVPGPLLAVLLSIGLNALYGAVYPDWAITTPDHLVQLPVPSTVAEFVGQFPRPSFARLGDWHMWWFALTLAAIASVETLLSVEAVDKLDPWRRSSSPNRELVAQGLGNLLSGFLGGLPMTSVIVRSSANVYAGARTPTSAVVHAILLGGLAVSVPFLLNLIPLAALAAVLLTVGYKLTKPALYTAMYHKGLDQFVPFLVTVLVTVFTDLLIGVGVGVASGLIAVLITNHSSSCAVVNDGPTWFIAFTKDVSFLNKARIRKVLAKIPDDAEVLIDGSRAQFIDRDILDLIEDFVALAPHRGIRVELRAVDSKAFPLKIPGV
jgi:MFS superfamily sulfate permease-like transporter